ncbi:MAG: MBL fold metallo-hydrolase [Candidatus Schekmanbacteria bacterium]|nr:MBL fold metallo-hydrolase [Candidatus Schekmanbacteria bacterium]
MSYIKTANIDEVLKIEMQSTVFGIPSKILRVSAYYIDGLLVDTGFQKIDKKLKELFSDRPLHTIVNTHNHEDHFGGNHLLTSVYRAKAFAHRDAMERIRTAPREFPVSNGLCWGLPKPSPISEIGKIVETDKFKIDVIETFGHSRGHISLYIRKRGWIIGGDIFLTKRPRFLRISESVAGTIDSLEKLIKLNPEKFFCASGKVLENPMADIKAKIDYLNDCREKILAFHKQGVQPEEIRDRVLGKEESFAKISRGYFSKINFVNDILKDSI